MTDKLLIEALEETRDTLVKVLIKIRRDAPDLSGKLLGHADQVIARVDTLLDAQAHRSQQEAAKEPVASDATRRADPLQLHAGAAVNDFTQDTLSRMLNALEEQNQLLREVRDLLSSDTRALPPAGSGQQPPQSSTVAPIMTMLAESRSKLYGRMSASQVAAAIGLNLTPRDRTRLGIALTKFGASRVRLVGNVFYTFGGESGLKNLTKIPEGPYRDLIDKHIDTLKTESPMTVERLGEIVGLSGRPLENLAKVLGPSGALGDDGSYRF